ncbi:MAG: type III polyketide synthase [Planctomycetes bacterium]|nr:type III polyketide synthase [Planctomycetota bacterium]
MRIAAVGEAFPEHYYDQATITRCLESIWQDDPAVRSRLSGLHQNVQVAGRHLALPLERYRRGLTFGEANDAWIDTSLRLGREAIDSALRSAGLGPRDVDAIFFSTVTGVASPSLDARLANVLGFRSDIKRVPMFGLGCVAGAAAVSRAVDYLLGHPDGVAVVLTVELCSLTLQTDDRSVANLISVGLFGDGASAAVLVGPQRAPAYPQAPEVLATRSVFYPDTEEVMGWTVSERGFSIVLSPQVPVVARECIPGDLDRFLADHGRTRAEVGSWVCHPGGPKVIQALADGLGLTPGDLELSWRTLREKGNLSSASVLLILRATMVERRPEPGTLGVMLAMGPGFCSELLLLGW